MNDGWWINYKTGERFPIHEHELWIREPANARALGISPADIPRFRRFVPVRDRDRFLGWLMKSAPVMRVRGHGDSVTFEYHARGDRLPLKAIRAFADREAGPLLRLRIVNLAGPKAVEVTPARLAKRFHYSRFPMCRHSGYHL